MEGKREKDDKGGRVSERKSEREKKRAREIEGGGDGGEERMRDGGTKHQRVSARIHAATHCNTLQHTATHCNTMQHERVSGTPPLASERDTEKRHRE